MEEIRYTDTPFFEESKPGTYLPLKLFLAGILFEYWSFT